MPTKNKKAKSRKRGKRTASPCQEKLVIIVTNGRNYRVFGVFYDRTEAELYARMWAGFVVPLEISPMDALAKDLQGRR